MPKARKKTSDKVKYPCHVCGTVLSSSYNLKTHLTTNCSTQKNFKCSTCNSKFLTQHSLKTHKELHLGEKKFVCSWCGHRFLSKGQLKVHERSHTKEKSFVCNVSILFFDVAHPATVSCFSRFARKDSATEKVWSRTAPCTLVSSLTCASAAP